MFKCGKIGHTASQCRVKCSHCNRWSHRANACCQAKVQQSQGQELATESSFRHWRGHMRKKCFWDLDGPINSPRKQQQRNLLAPGLATRPQREHTPEIPPALDTCNTQRQNRLRQGHGKWTFYFKNNQLPIGIGTTTTTAKLDSGADVNIISKQFLDTCLVNIKAYFKT